MNTYLLIALAAGAAALIAFVITYFVMRAQQIKACNALENELIAAQKDLENAQKLQKMQQESFSAQLEAVRSQLTAETEKLLKQREESLQKKAEETFRNLTDPLGKDLKAMQESFDAQKRSQTEGTATLKTAVEQAVKHLQDQTQAIGSKADNLAQALTIPDYIVFSIIGLIGGALVAYPIAMHKARSWTELMLRKVSHEALIGAFCGLVCMLAFYEAGILGIFLALTIGIVGGFLHTEFGIQLGDSGIDIIGGLPDNLLFLFDRALIVDCDHLVENVGRPLRGCVVQRQIHNTF
jgi:hypothetical protein